MLIQFDPLSDALAEIFSCRKVYGMDFNLLAVVGFTKMLADIFSPF